MKILHVFTLATTVEAFFDGQFKFLTERGQHITLCCSKSSTVENFASRNGVSYVPIEIARSFDTSSDIKAIRKLISFIRKEKFDVIVGHTPKGALLSMVAARIAGCKKRVYLRHGLIYTTAVGIKRAILKAEEKFVSSLATHIINVSPSLSKLAVSDRLNEESKQVVLGCGTCGGIDTINQFNPKNLDYDELKALRLSQKIYKDDYVIGFCGRLCKDKGISELIAGYEMFKEEHPSIKTKLLLVGGYDGRDFLPQAIHDKIDSNDDIIRVGHILKNIQNYYALMDLFVFPSHREGFGMCSIEAQAMGIPVLAAKSHGCIDTILENVTGEYIDLTPESICYHMYNLYDKSKRQNMGIAARKFVCENFERTNLWPLILKYYNSL